MLLPALLIKVLVVTGGHGHEPAFYSVFDDPQFTVNIEPHPNAFRSDIRKQADVLVLSDMIQDLGDEKKRANVKAFVEAGRELSFCTTRSATRRNGSGGWKRSLGASSTRRRSSTSTKCRSR